MITDKSNIMQRQGDFIARKLILMEARLAECERLIELYRCRCGDKDTLTFGDFVETQDDTLTFGDFANAASDALTFSDFVDTHDDTLTFADFID